MTEYKVLRLATVKEYEDSKDIKTIFSYNFQDGNMGEVSLNRLLIPNVASITHENITTGLDCSSSYYKSFHDDYIAGIEIDETNNDMIPIKERSYIVFGKKVE
jgi:hypothetical protein